MNNTAKVINITDKRREDIAARYKEIKAQQSALAKEEKLLKAELLGWVAPDSTATIGAFTVVHTVTTKRTLDTDTLKKELPELWNEYGKDGESHSIKVI